MLYDKDIVSFDIDTTGVRRGVDQTIHIVMVKFNVEDDGNLKSSDKRNWYIKPCGNYEITLQAYLKHGITPKFLEDKPSLKDIAPSIIEFCEGCDFLTYNGVSFDIPFLESELNKYGYSLNVLSRKCYDIFKEETRRNSNKLDDMFKRYSNMSLEERGLSKNNPYNNVCANMIIFNAQQKIKHYDAEKIVCVDGFIEEHEFNGKQELCFSNGKYKGIAVWYVKMIDEAYIDWIMESTSFSDGIKRIISKAKQVA